MYYIQIPEKQVHFVLFPTVQIKRTSCMEGKSGGKKPCLKDTDQDIKGKL